jgi:hypothetical protein
VPGVDDSLHATRAMVEEGNFPGGGALACASLIPGKLQDALGLGPTGRKPRVRRDICNRWHDLSVARARQRTAHLNPDEIKALVDEAMEWARRP